MPALAQVLDGPAASNSVQAAVLFDSDPTARTLADILETMMSRALPSRNPTPEIIALAWKDQKAPAREAANALKAATRFEQKCSLLSTSTEQVAEDRLSDAGGPSVSVWDQLGWGLPGQRRPAARVLIVKALDASCVFPPPIRRSLPTIEKAEHQ